MYLRKCVALEIDYLRRPAMYQNYKKILNSTIRNKMQAEQLILHRIQWRQLKCYGHLLRMNDIH